MSRGATLSIMGLYNNDDSIFDYMSFPEGFSSEQKRTVTDNILLECAELEILYPNSTVMKNIIGIWSRKELPYWERVYKASLLEYNPIENYRRNETETISDDRSEEHSGSDSTVTNSTNTDIQSGTETKKSDNSNILQRTETDNLNNSGSDRITGNSKTNTINGGNDVIEHNITGYDSNTLVPNTEDNTTYGKTEDTESNGSNVTQYGKSEKRSISGQDTNTYNGTDTTENNLTGTNTIEKNDVFQHGEKIDHTGKSERTTLAYGNIGVTTSQDMLTAELEIAKIINVMNIIIESFKERFCIMVW